MSKLIILAGISGSGKSTYRKQLVSEGYKFVCPDTIRQEVTGSESDLTKDGYVWSVCVPRALEQALFGGYDVVFDALMIRIRDRTNIRKIGQYCGAQVECHFFEPKIDRAKRQNKLRDRQVPDEIIETQASEWVEPTTEEGFSQVVNLDKYRGKTNSA